MKGLLKKKPIKLHRCRLMDFVPSPIVAITFSPDGAQLAVARQDGDIEIWSTASYWFVERIIWNKDSVRSLAWISANGENRLFSAGLGGNIIEWDLSTSTKKHSTDSYGGPVWSLAVDPAGEHLAAACDEGIRLFDISYGDIQLKKTFNKAGKGRTLSVAWNKEGNLIYTGGTDGHVRQWKLESTTCTLSLKIGSKGCPIWALAVLPEGSLIMGDSRGILSVWDPVTTTQIYSVKSHNGDVLCLAYALCGDSQVGVVATGADSNMFSIRRVATNGPSRYEWSQADQFRHHLRDVFALAISPQQILASGGLDGSLHALPLSSVLQSDKRPGLFMHPPLPPHPRVSFSPAKRRFLYKASPSALEVWSAGREESQKAETDRRAKLNGALLPVADMPELLAEIHIKSGEKIISSVLSPNGNAIACADTLGLKIFRLRKKTSLKVHKQEVPGLEPVPWVIWVDDTYMAAGTNSGGVQIINTALAVPTVVASCSSDWSRTVKPWTGTTAASINSKWIAAVRSGGGVDVFRLNHKSDETDGNGDEVELKLHGSIPPPETVGAGVTALGFRPDTSELLVVRTLEEGQTTCS